MLFVGLLARLLVYLFVCGVVALDGCVRLLVLLCSCVADELACGLFVRSLACLVVCLFSLFV